MTKMRNSIKMRGMYLLHFVLLTGTMIGAWFLWCAPLLDARNAQTVSLAVCTCYVVCSIFLLRTYNAYKIGIFCWRQEYHWKYLPRNGGKTTRDLLELHKNLPQISRSSISDSTSG